MLCDTSPNHPTYQFHTHWTGPISISMPSRYTIGPEGNEGMFDGKVQLLDRHVLGPQSHSHEWPCNSSGYMLPTDRKHVSDVSVCDFMLSHVFVSL